MGWGNWDILIYESNSKLVLFQVGSILCLEETKIGKPRFKADASLRTVKNQWSAWANLAGSFTCSGDEINREQKEALFHQWTWGSCCFTDISSGVLNFFSCAIFFGVKHSETVWWYHLQDLHCVLYILNFFATLTTFLIFWGFFFFLLISYVWDVWDGWCPGCFLL